MIGSVRWKMFVLIAMLLVLPFAVHASNDSIQLQLKWKDQFQFAGYYVALEKGYYKAAGLDVELIEGDETTHSVEFLQKHPHAYAVAGADALRAYGQGASIKVLFALLHHSPLALAVREDSGIQSFADLRGKHVMLHSGVQDAEILAALQKVGVAEADITIMPSSSDLVASLIEREADAVNVYMSNEPYTLKEKGIAYRLLKPINEGFDFYNDFLVTSTEETLEHPLRVAAFVHATKRGWEEAMTHKRETIDLILQNYNSQHLSREKLLFEANVLEKLMAWSATDLGYIGRHHMQQMMQTFVDLGWLSAPLDVENFIYDVEHLGPIERWVEQHLWQLISVGLVLLLIVLIIALALFRQMLAQRTASMLENHAMWRHFVDIADVGIFVHRHGRMLFANDYMLQRIQLTAEEVVGREVAKYIHPDDMAAVAQRLHDVMNHDRVIDAAPVRYLNDAGDVFDVEF